MDKPEGWSHESEKDSEAPEREPGSIGDNSHDVPEEKPHRERIDDEIEAAMRETPFISDKDREQRLGAIMDEMIVTEDDKKRHALAVERVALLRLGKRMKGEAAEVPVSTAIDNLEDIPTLSPEREQRYPMIGVAVPRRRLGSSPSPRSVEKPADITAVRPVSPPEKESSEAA